MILLWTFIICSFSGSTEALLEISKLNCNVKTTAISNNAISLGNLCGTPSITLVPNQLTLDGVLSQEVKILLSSLGPLLGVNQMDGLDPFIKVIGTTNIPSGKYLFYFKFV